MDLKALQEKLNLAKIGIKDLDNEISLLQAEKQYQELISQFSPAYLSGSKWYVGTSLREYLKKQSVSTNILLPLFYLSHKLDKKN